MDPELNSLEADFNVKLDRWISKQGTVFQIQHAKGIDSLFPKLCVLAFKVLLIVLVCLGLFWFYLSNKSNSEGYREMVKDNIIERFDTTGVTVKSIQRIDKGIIDGEMKISRVVLEASEDTFFQDWYVMESDEDQYGRIKKVEDKRFFTIDGISVSPFGITDGIFSGWKSNKIEISSLTCNLKVGADTDQNALDNYQQLFKPADKIDVRNVSIGEATIMWGLGADKGSIRNAGIKAQYADNAWVIDVEGGQFNHGWIKNADIQGMKIICNKSGQIEIEHAQLNIDGSPFEISATITVKAKPQVAGKYTFKEVDLLRFIGRDYEKWFSGKIKGSGVISGQMNTLKGLKTVTDIELNSVKSPVGESSLGSSERIRSAEDSRVFIRGTFSLFQNVLQYRDTLNSYALLELDTGGFQVTQHGNDTSFKISDARVGNFLLMKGDFTYNAVSASEIDADKETAQNVDAVDSVESFGLRFDSEDETDLVNRFDGEMKLGFLPEVFGKYPEILTAYPMDITTGRVWIPVEMKDGLNDITSKIAEELDQMIQKSEDKRK